MDKSNLAVTTPFPREVRWHDEPRPWWLPQYGADLEGRVVLRRCQVQHGSRHRRGVCVGGVEPDLDPKALTTSATACWVWRWWIDGPGRRNGSCGFVETREAAIAALDAAVAQRGWVVRYD